MTTTKTTKTPTVEMSFTREELSELFDALRAHQVTLARALVDDGHRDLAARLDHTTALFVAVVSARRVLVADDEQVTRRPHLDRARRRAELMAQPELSIDELAELHALHNAHYASKANR